MCSTGGPLRGGSPLVNFGPRVVEDPNKISLDCKIWFGSRNNLCEELEAQIHRDGILLVTMLQFGRSGKRFLRVKRPVEGSHHPA